MKVMATKVGYYGLKLRREGVVFTINDPKHFSKRWMEEVGGEEVQEVKPTKKSGKPTTKGLSKDEEVI